jgi:hypothetical protein
MKETIVTEILKSVKKERVEKPMRVVLVGIDGIGKSTFGSQAPAPIFIGAEDGTSELEVCRYPGEPKSWNDIFTAIQVLATEGHEFKTLVLDTVDWAEPLCWAHVCSENNWKSMEASPFYRAYGVAQDQWRRLLAALDHLRATKGMHIILLGHSIVKTFRNPEGEDYDRYQLKLHDKSAALLREWADAVLFASYETFTVEKGSRSIGVSNGARVLHTERRAAFDAKNRYNLPPKLALDWNEFDAAVKARATASSDELRQRIAKMLEELGDAAFAATARTVVDKAGGDPIELSKIANKVAARLGRKQEVA